MLGVVDCIYPSQVSPCDGYEGALGCNNHDKEKDLVRVLGDFIVNNVERNGLEVIATYAPDSAAIPRKHDST